MNIIYFILHEIVITIIICYFLISIPDDFFNWMRLRNNAVIKKAYKPHRGLKKCKLL